MKKNIKILDCTLRDGGYINNWLFGEKNICTIINNLIQAEINYIECGFLKENNNVIDKTFFSKIIFLEKFITSNTNLTLMLNFGEYSISNFSECKNKNLKIRVAFKKHQQKEALEYISNLTNLGWDVFANPMSSSTYSKEELKNLVSNINEIKPYGLSIVDTLGNLEEIQIFDIFKFIDENLEKNIALGFHSHNSMQLSFSNAKTLLNMNLNREIIIDSCLYGMGRGAGNLCTELITKYLNDNFETNYKILPIIKTIDKVIKPIYEKTPWGYSTLYYIAAINGCHPNYATFLNNKNLSDEKINNILNSIPLEKKTNFDMDFIKNLTQNF